MKVMEKVESQTGQKSSISSEVHFPTTVKAIRDNIIHHLMSFQGRDPERSGAKDVYKALAYTMRDIMVEKWISTQKTFYAKEKKRVYYLSLEFLIGRSLGNSITNLGMFAAAKKAVEDLGFDMAFWFPKKQEYINGEEISLLQQNV